ncbi:hypothetical protein [Methylobacterium sp. J-070]|uniref:hypothetical protein n=1 Tax=Methylobacterium sp. J-070 TaxID=2836650 RepID=UPI001FB9E305|nr:hypothetical protein [Methylobacterium sp. J-070]MCJ2048615.1 hypothetical protein [Methylobacterium sp. J-070]
MSGPANRRGFLRGLTTLPLIGGSVALIGTPVRAAQPVTPGMLATYSAWLHFEQRAIQCAVGMENGTFIPCLNPGSHFHFDHFSKDRFALDAQLRAPVVLSAVGCPLTSVEAEEAWATTFRPVVQEGRR